MAREKLEAFVRAAADLDGNPDAMAAWLSTSSMDSLLRRATLALTHVLAKIEREKER